jgi:hypothetical protein
VTRRDAALTKLRLVYDICNCAIIVNSASTTVNLHFFWHSLDDYRYLSRIQLNPSAGRVTIRALHV